MKEFSTRFELFKMGLRKRDLRQLNQVGLVQCDGFRLTDGGLEPIAAITNPITDILANSDWPFPQLFRFSSFTYLLTRHYLYSVDASWNLTQHPTWFHSGGIWHGFDSHTYVGFTNGTVVLLRDPTTTDFRIATAAEFPACQTVCNFKGQLVTGGLLTGYGGNWVQWSDIGSATFSQTRSNEAGAMPMPFDGDVLVVKRLGDLVMVYGENGVVSLSPVSQPTIAFKKDELLGYGIASRGAVGGALHEHIFVDEIGYLRKATMKGIETLGYKEFFEPMLGTDIVIQYNAIEEEYYISNDVSGYILTPHGLTAMHERISGGAIFDGVFIGCSTPIIRSYHTIVSNPFDMNRRGDKTISFVAFSSTNATGIQVAVDWRMGSMQSFSRSPFFPVNIEGVAELRVVGTEFRLVVRVPINQSPELSGEVMIGYNNSDKRFVRGTYATAKDQG